MAASTPFSVRGMYGAPQLAHWVYSAAQARQWMVLERGRRSRTFTLKLGIRPSVLSSQF